MTDLGFRARQIGPWQVWRGRNVLLCVDRFTPDRRLARRVLLSRHPVWLPFSERNGHRPGPRVIRLGRYDVAIYGGDRG